MKNSKKKIWLVIVFAIILISIIIGYTYSKYSQSISIQTSSAVAKWQFAGEVKNDSKSSTTAKISLADTISSDSIVTNRIAPGTSGQFKIIIDASGSETDIDYKVELEEESYKPENLVFKYGDKTYKNLSDLIPLIKSETSESTEEVSEKENLLSGTISKSANSKPVEYTIEWEWPYETIENGVAQDEQDTKDGLKANDYTFTVKITGNQSK